MSVLAGDKAYSVSEGVGLHLRFRNDALELVAPTAVDSDRQIVKGMPDDVYVTNRKGERLTEVDNGAMALLFSWGLTEEQDMTAEYLYQRFISKESRIEFGHAALVSILKGESTGQGSPHWRKYLSAEQVSKTVTNFDATLEAAMSAGLAGTVFTFCPESMPTFIAPRVVSFI